MEWGFPSRQGWFRLQSTADVDKWSDRKLRATEGLALTLIELSRHVFEPLRRDEDSILYRGRNHEDLSQVLVLAPAREGAGRESLKRLEHEYSFRGELDPAWAARPIAITSTGTDLCSCWRILVDPP